jgi:hypothetical protein
MAIISNTSVITMKTEITTLPVQKTSFPFIGSTETKQTHNRYAKESIAKFNQLYKTTNSTDIATLDIGVQKMEKALRGELPIQVVTVTRCNGNASIGFTNDNSLIISAERFLLSKIICHLIEGTPLTPKMFKIFLKKLEEDIKRYMKLRNLLKKSMKSKRGLVSRKEIAKFYLSGISMESGNFIEDSKLEEAAEAIAEEQMSKKEENGLSTEVKKILKNKLGKSLAQKVFNYYSEDFDTFEIDTVRICFSPEDAAFYQSMSENYRKNDSDKSLLNRLSEIYRLQWDILCQRIQEQYIATSHVPSIVIWDEYFFGKCVISRAEMEKELLQLSTWCPGNIFCPNFMYIKETKVEKILSNLLALEKENLPMFSEYMINTPFREKHVEKYKSWLGNTKEANSYQAFVNETWYFFNGKLCKTYDKCTYFQEENDLLQRGIPYFFGNKKESVITRDIPQLSTEICRDLFVGARQTDKKHYRFHILQSSSIDISKLFKNLPQNSKYIIHVNRKNWGAIYEKVDRFINTSKISQSAEKGWSPHGPEQLKLLFTLGVKGYKISCFTVCR